jgi:hypothetical protein
MEIEYDSNIEDSVEFNLYMFSHEPQLKQRLKIWRIIYIAGVAIFGCLGIASIFLLDSTVTLVFFAAAIICFVFYWFNFRSSQIKQRIRKAVIKQYPKIPNDEICRHKLSISEEGLRESTEFGNRIDNWSAFNEIIKTDKYLYIFFRTGKGYSVPKRAFTDDKAFNLFAETAKGYLSKVSN